MKNAYLKTLLTLFFILLSSCNGQDVSLFTDSANKNNNQTTPGLDDVSGTDSTEVGNGGDLIQCWPLPPLFPHPINEGWYLLDYAEIREQRVPFVHRPFLEDYLNHFIQVIEYSAPELMSSLDNYLNSLPFIEMERPTSEGEPSREWVATEQNEEIKDENPSYIPRNCRLRPEFGHQKNRQLKLHQVVVRHAHRNQAGDISKVTYSYDTALVEKIGDQPLQLSMLIVHE